MKLVILMARILYDATALSRKRTGIENFTFHLLKTLLQVDVSNEYHIVFRKVIDHEIKEVAGTNVRLYLSPFKSQILTEQVYVPFLKIVSTY